jgi:branched-subunit amino acid ABC-type transport system permease component
MIPLLIANLLALASLLIMMSSGLALIYGLRDVINFGHGALYMLGGRRSSSLRSFWRSWEPPSNIWRCGRCKGDRILKWRLSR